MRRRFAVCLAAVAALFSASFSAADTLKIPFSAAYTRVEQVKKTGDSTAGSWYMTRESARLTSLQILKDGKILLSGFRVPVADFEAETYNEEPRDLFLMRLLPDGKLDDGFGAGGYVKVGSNSNQPFQEKNPSVVVLDNERMLVAYSEAHYSRELRHYVSSVKLTRLLPNGSRDSSFGENGTLQLIARPEPDYDAIPTVVSLSRVSANQFILVVKASENRKTTGVIRLNQDGALDASFGPAGLQKLFGTSPSVPVVLSSGEVIVPNRGERWSCGPWSGGVQSCTYAYGTFFNILNGKDQAAQDRIAGPATLGFERQWMAGAYEVGQNKILTAYNWNTVRPGAEVGVFRKIVDAQSKRLAVDNDYGNLKRKTFPGEFKETGAEPYFSIKPPSGYEKISAHAIVPDKASGKSLVIGSIQISKSPAQFHCGQGFVGCGDALYIARGTENGWLDKTFGDEGYLVLPVTENNTTVLERSQAVVSQNQLVIAHIEADVTARALNMPDGSVRTGAFMPKAIVIQRLHLWF